MSPSLSSLLSSEEDILVKKLQLSHDPDGRNLDSELLLRAMEDVMHYASTTSQGTDTYFGATANNCISSIESDGLQEPLGQTIHKISSEILCECFGEENLHTRTMVLLDLLGSYRWDAKLALVLAAFASSYGAFWLLMQQCPHNPLALSIAILKQLPSDLSALKPRFKALRLLIKTMVDVTKCIIEFENLPTTYVKLNNETMAVTRSHICVSAYWITRSAMACFSHITDLTAMKPEQHSNSTTIAAWELISLVYRLGSIHGCLKLQVDVCREQIETKMHQKLLSLFKNTYLDNQEVLKALFAFKNDLPLKDCSSQAKVGVDKLKSKVVILLISKPELLPFENLFFLVHRAYENPKNEKVNQTYEIVWVPISLSESWTDSEKRSFDCLSNTLPWYSIWQPWLLSSEVRNYMKQEWNCKDETVMVVLDEQGKVTHSNAIDMVLIWGAKAYPFSVSREEELWEGEKWTLQLLIDEIDPILTHWVEDGRNLCIFGSEDLEWIRELGARMKEIRAFGVQLEMVYVGKKDLIRDILATIDAENLCGNSNSSLSLAKINIFWLRLESMRRSRTRVGKMAETDHILNEVSALLDYHDSKTSWAMLGTVSSMDIVKCRGRELLECLNLFPEWRKNVADLGFIGSLRNALDPPSLAGPCGHSSQTCYAERSCEGAVFCEKCKWPMKKFVVYE